MYTKTAVFLSSTYRCIVYHSCICGAVCTVMYLQMCYVPLMYLFVPVLCSQTSLYYLAPAIYLQTCPAPLCTSHILTDVSCATLYQSHTYRSIIYFIPVMLHTDVSCNILYKCHVHGLMCTSPVVQRQTMYQSCWTWLRASRL